MVSKTNPAPRPPLNRSKKDELYDRMIGYALDGVPGGHELVDAQANILMLSDIVKYPTLDKAKKAVRERLAGIADYRFPTGIGVMTKIKDYYGLTTREIWAGTRSVRNLRW